MPHWVGVARRPRSAPKKCRLNSVSGLCGRFVEGGDELAGLRVGLDRAGEFHVGAEAVRGEEDPVAVAGLGVAEVDRRPEIGAGSAELSIDVGADLRELRAVRLRSSVPKFASASEQEVLPSAALGLIEKPTGSVTVAALISDGEGKVGLRSCGTVRSTSTPEAESVAVVVGLALRLGLKVSWSQPVLAGHGVAGRVDAVVVADDRRPMLSQRFVAGSRV